MSIHEELSTTVRPPTAQPAHPSSPSASDRSSPSLPAPSPPSASDPRPPALPDLPGQKSVPRRGPAPLRFVALGDSLTEGVGDPVGRGRRGWAALLAQSLGGRAEFANLAVSGALTRDVADRQLPVALELRPDLVSVVVGVNDTLRGSFDIHAVARRLDTVYAAVTARRAVLLTACLPDPGAMLRLPRALATPLARRQRGVNEVVHVLSGRYGALHLHAADGRWTTDPAMWSVDRLHPGERGHRTLARAFHALLADAGLATGSPPGPEPQSPPPPRGAGAWWMATRGTAWLARRSVDLLPELLRLAAAEAGHRTPGATARLDVEASRAVTSALAGITPPSAPRP
ncbi:SGNH/GDSL hydrolase family protein [Streptomyces chilikensis]|uniref:SGNH/GDSL hydrolase family protein n=1 Tax=Streptomyces chilikensis TaxID=1194079 RepID=UPI00140CDF8F|nr:SGNH/GDSL hydrolase family protein [Streptomyces chilikensis]